MKKRFSILVTLIVLLAVMLIAAEPTLAQCAMCKQTVAASDDATNLSGTINSAVVILLMPAIFLFVGLFGVFYKFRNVQGQRKDQLYSRTE